MEWLIHKNETLSCLYYEDTENVVCNETAYHHAVEHLTSANPVFWALVCVYIFLVLVCGIMQGLVLVLASCDLTSLKVMSEAGLEKTRKYAKRLIPMARRHHLILVSLIVANATAATAMPICFERLTNPIISIVVSATAFLIFGEILPQAICSRYGLPIGYYMSWLVWFLTGLFYIIAYPFSLLLDRVLGKDSGTLYKRKELSALVDMHGPILPASEEGMIGCGRRRTIDVALERLSTDEVLVIKGALAMSSKTAADVMVKLEDVYMLPSNAILDEALAHEIFNVGHSRIPVYQNQRTNVIGVIFTKRLIMIDKSEGLPIGSIFSGHDAERSLYPPYLVDETTPVYDLLNQFQTGILTHMAFVTTTATTETDFLVIGIVTLEDLIEELLQEEIRDESDVQRQWRLQVAKARVARRLRRGLESTSQENAGRMVRCSSAPSLIGLHYSSDNEHIGRKSSLHLVHAG